jgi:hypothetical protein
VRSPGHVTGSARLSSPPEQDCIMSHPLPPSQRVARLGVVLFLPFLAAGTAAQSTLVGLSRVSPLVVSQNTTSCALAQCTPAGVPPPPASTPFVGGTAYDSGSRGLWVSNGLVIAKVDPRNACAPQCPVLPMPNTTPNNPVTGLAYYEPANTVYVTDQSGIIRWYTVGGGCQLSLAGRCIAPIPAGDVLTGCATDDQTGQIFYSAVTPGSPGGRVYVAQIGSPCTPFCSFTVTMCGTNTMGPIVGLAYDACPDVLWVTDGRFTVGLSVNPITCTVTGSIQCCVNTLEPYIGLDVLSNTETSSGSNCTAGTCPTCPTMEHVLPSEPYLGNAAFSLDLIDAPGGATVFALVNAGPCTPGLTLPPFCAPFFVSLASPIVFGTVTGGTPGMCNGAASVPLPIPNLPWFCGVPLCSQYIGFCPGSGFFANNLVSNALGWTIVGS